MHHSRLTTHTPEHNTEDPDRKPIRPNLKREQHSKVQHESQAPNGQVYEQSHGYVRRGACLPLIRRNPSYTNMTPAMTQGSTIHNIPNATAEKFTVASNVLHDWKHTMTSTHTIDVSTAKPFPSIYVSHAPKITLDWCTTISSVCDAHEGHHTQTPTPPTAATEYDSAIAHICYRAPTVLSPSHDQDVS